jgi:DNA-binding transcriptional regulator GbsR (MarR family)
MTTSKDKLMSEEEVTFSEIIGDLVEQWGFKRHLGRIWCLLFMRGTPTSPSTIQEALELSAGSVSSSLTELQAWGVIKRIRLPGDRNFYFEPELNIWRSISNVLRAREIRILEQAKDSLTILLQNLQKKSSSKETELRAKRLKHVVEVLDTMLGLLGHLAMPSPLAFTKMSVLFARLKSL